jgi:SAM-dependent methyltransferase
VHLTQTKFCRNLSYRFPSKFNNVSVLDVGSRDITGNNRIFLEDYEYLGVDCAAGRNVDIVSYIHKYKARERFDLVICTEMLEHDPYWKESIQAMIKLVKEGGLLVITCANKNRKLHGEEWSIDKYYKNITLPMMLKTLEPLKVFQAFGIESARNEQDLYFWGLKKEAQ